MVRRWGLAVCVLGCGVLLGGSELIAGAATVRGVTGGDETVPTVVAPDRAYVNPDPALIRDLARSRS